MDKTRRAKCGKGICMEEGRMIRSAVTALEKMKDMFGAVLCSTEDPSAKSQVDTSGCAMNKKCQKQGCPFRGPGVPNVLQSFCGKGRNPEAKNGRNAGMPLMPGEVGLRGDRATFHLGQSPGQPVSMAKNGRPSAATYYNVRPTGPPVSAMAAGRGAQPPKQRRHAMQVLPELPASADRAVGPVTGLPIAGDEHVFVIKLGKQYDEQDDMVNLQVEVRLPKQRDPVQTDTGTQFLASDVKPAQSTKAGKKGKKGKKDKKGKKGKKGKK